MSVAYSVRPLNALTVDVEDYFQVSAFEHRIARSEWDHWESRVVASTRRLLAIFDDFSVKGTFFVLGWVAKRFPALVEEIDARGHEIGSHSYWHQLIYRLTPDEFRNDLRQSKEILENIINRGVKLFRAPSFSITSRSRWALEILADEGFDVDSSVYPVRHDRYGIPGAPRDPYLHDLPGKNLLEFPPSTLSVGRTRLPISGGGYFRLYPFSLTRRAIEQTNRRGCPFMFYIHPWEVDPHQPRIRDVGWKSRARHYVNLSRTEEKLRRLLSTVRFGTLSQSLVEWARRSPHIASEHVLNPASMSL